MRAAGIPTVLDDQPTTLRHIYPCEGTLDAIIRNTVGLASYHKLNEAAGATLVDSTGNACTTVFTAGTPQTAPLWVSDVTTNYCYRNSAAGGVLSIQNNPAALLQWLNFHDFSVEMMVRPRSLASNMTAYCTYSGTVADRSLFAIRILSTGAVGVLFGTNAYTSAAGVVAVNNVYHIAVTLTSVYTIKVYVNGVEVVSATGGPLKLTSPWYTSIGAQNVAGSTELYNGDISDVALYLRGLLPSEVQRRARAAGVLSEGTTVPVVRSSRTFLGKAYTGTVLPKSSLVNDPDTISGEYTLRIGDAGEFSCEFPNGTASDGVAWRDRFSTDGHQEFIEIYRGSDLQFVGNVQKVTTNLDKVVISGVDALALLKKAYDTGQSVVATPADLAKTYGSAWRYLVGMNFASPAIESWGSQFAAFRLTASQLDSGVRFTVGATLETNTDAAILATPIPPADIDALNWDAGFGIRSWTEGAIIGIDLMGACTFGLTSLAGVNTLSVDSHNRDYSTYYSMVVPAGQVKTGQPVSLQVSRRGRWFYLSLNGALMMTIPSIENLPPVGLKLYFSTITAFDIEHAFFRTLATVLPPSAEVVVPGSLPTGGLRGKYYNDGDLQGNASYKRLPFLPSKVPYAERIDATIDTGSITIPVQPGASNGSEFFTVRWTGAIYLTNRNYGLSLQADDGCRLWLGSAAWDEPVIDAWNAPATNTTTVTPDRWGSVAGWVPIVIEYRQETSGRVAILKFTPTGSGTYTDPGGTVLTLGTQVTVPATSLSPYGCFVDDVQGESHFSILQRALGDAFGYSIWCQPQSLESGFFPGTLSVKARQGSDTAIVLGDDNLAVDDPFFSPGRELDAGDFATTLFGVGSGSSAANAKNVVQSSTFDLSQLFDMQAITDAPETTDPRILRMQTDAQLDLRARSWESISGNARAQTMRSDTFPLSDASALVKWLPGDGVRLRFPAVGIEDTVPRQIRQITRRFFPMSRTTTDIAFRERPKSVLASLRKVAGTASSQHRMYQPQLVRVMSEYIPSDIVATSGYTAYARIVHHHGEKIVRAIFKASVNTNNGSWRLFINNVDRTADLGGPWTRAPVYLDVTRFMNVTGTDVRTYFRIQNVSGTNSQYEAVCEMDVLR